MRFRPAERCYSFSGCSPRTDESGRAAASRFSTLSDCPRASQGKEAERILLRELGTRHETGHRGGCKWRSTSPRTRSTPKTNTEVRTLLSNVSIGNCVFWGGREGRTHLDLFDLKPDAPMANHWVFASFVREVSQKRMLRRGVSARTCLTTCMRLDLIS